MEQYLGIACIISFLILVRATRLLSKTLQSITPVLRGKEILFDSSLGDLEKEKALQGLAFLSLKNLSRLIVSLVIVFGVPSCVVYFVHLIGWVQYQEVVEFLLSPRVIIVSSLLTIVVMLKK